MKSKDSNNKRNTATVYVYNQGPQPQNYLDDYSKDFRDENGNKFSKADYLYRKGATNWNWAPAQMLGHYMLNNGKAVDFSDNEDMLRQYYAAYLVSNGRTNLDDRTYEIGLHQPPLKDYTIDMKMHSPLRYTFAQTGEAFVNDNDTIKMHDRYDFHTDYHKINEERKARGKLPLHIGPV